MFAVGLFTRARGSSFTDNDGDIFVGSHLISFSLETMTVLTGIQRVFRLSSWRQE